MRVSSLPKLVRLPWVETRWAAETVGGRLYWSVWRWSAGGSRVELVWSRVCLWCGVLLLEPASL
eukprot:13286247-Heterocapsa_arctica.AAC.1